MALKSGSTDSLSLLHYIAELRHIISDMSQRCGHCKLVAIAVLACVTTSSIIVEKPQLCILNTLLMIVFAGLDAYYLSFERFFKIKLDQVIGCANRGEIAADLIPNVDLGDAPIKRLTLVLVNLSHPSISLFYGVLIVICFFMGTIGSFFLA